MLHSKSSNKRIPKRALKSSVPNPFAKTLQNANRSFAETGANSFLLNAKPGRLEIDMIVTVSRHYNIANRWVPSSVYKIIAGSPGLYAIQDCVDKRIFLVDDLKIGWRRKALDLFTSNRFALLEETDNVDEEWEVKKDKNDIGNNAVSTTTPVQASAAAMPHKSVESSTTARRKRIKKGKSTKKCETCEEEEKEGQGHSSISTRKDAPMTSPPSLPVPIVQAASSTVDVVNPISNDLRAEQDAHSPTEVIGSVASTLDSAEASLAEPVPVETTSTAPTVGTTAATVEIGAPMDAISSTPPKACVESTQTAATMTDKSAASVVATPMIFASCAPSTATPSFPRVNAVVAAVVITSFLFVAASGTPLASTVRNKTNNHSLPEISAAAPLQLTVKKLDGGSITIKCKASDTIVSVKRMLGKSKYCIMPRYLSFRQTSHNLPCRSRL